MKFIKLFVRVSLGCLGLFGCSMACAQSARAETRLPAIFGDHMVLQRERPIPVWGTDAPNQAVTVSFAGQKAATKSDSAGKWLVKLPAQKAVGEAVDLTVTGSSTVVCHDVLLGEVWFASGQSNMWFPLNQALNPAEEIKAANYPQLRLFTVQRAAAPQPAADVSGTWAACTPESAKLFSAVAYFFGRDLQKALGVPIGIIHSSWPGSYIESWISAPTLAKDPDDPVIQGRWNLATSHMPAAMDAYKKAYADWQTASAAAKAEGNKKLPAEPRSPLGAPFIPDADHAGFLLDQSVEHYFVAHPSGIYNGMVAPLMPFAIRGVLWYQGESNFVRPVAYARLFPEMITDWRANWGQGDFPFLYVQLPYIGGRLKPTDPPLDSYYSFPLVREAQRRAQSVPQTAMIVTTDNTVDTDIHPRNKQLFGARLANAALNVAYGQDVPYRGPDYVSSQLEGSAIRVKFDSHGGLVAKGGGLLKGFAIAGADHCFQWAQARIDGESVLVSSPAVPQPVAVRYGWNNSADWNLFNAAGLPASPFQTDDYAPEPAKAR